MYDVLIALGSFVAGGYFYKVAIADVTKALGEVKLDIESLFHSNAATNAKLATHIATTTAATTAATPKA